MSDDLTDDVALESASEAVLSAPNAPSVPIVGLKSSDDEIVPMSTVAVAMSATLRNIMSDVDITDEPLFVPGVTGDTLRCIKRYCDYHCARSASTSASASASTSTTSTEPSVSLVMQWDKQFAQALSDSQLICCMIAANFLDIAPLLELLCDRMGACIKPLSVEDIRQRFNIPDDLSAEEKAQIARENAWSVDA